MDEGSKGVPYTPFHKNNKKLQKMCGMLIYKLNSGVETIRDECSGVGVETSATPKYETA